MIFKNIKVRLYPTIKQKKMLDMHFDAYRFAYNLCLEYKSFMWKHYSISKSGYDLQRELFEVRKSSKWLSKCKSECVREAALECNKTFIKFFNGLGYPRYKSKKSRQSFKAHQCIYALNSNIGFFGYIIKYRTSQSYRTAIESGKIKTITFKRDLSGDYFASCLIESEKSPLPISIKRVGVDLGLSDLLTTSDGVKYPNNRYLKNSHFKIRKLQRKFSRSRKGSNNGNKLRIKIAKLYCYVTRQREYYYHQITNELIRDNQTIVLETLRVKNMGKNHRLARSIYDASWGDIVRMLIYKADWTSREIVRIDSFYPSTKTCSSCGKIKDIPLKERMYNCECGLSLDRDINAAINIRNAGLKIPGVSVEGEVTNPAKQKVNV